MAEVGVFVVPAAGDAARTVEQVVAAEEAGLDLVGIQDHPYQRRFLDTFTLLAYVAARTERIKLAPDVANLPLRPPTMIAKAAASIDVLSGGRFELGLGAGAFWDNIAAMGGPKLGPKESVDALEDAIPAIRSFWSGEQQGDLKPGPPPAHPIGIWLGAYGPRMLRLTGRLADGWLPSLGNLDEKTIPERQQAIDEAAAKAGRAPGDIRRLINVGMDTDPDRLVRLAAEERFDTLILSLGDGDPREAIERIGSELAPRLRDAA
jgi:alkanesulfonate monooxygenase SsuD/methylene tetrahydromethanopterin reductase-like flavin-dependent oxidoreductase (luciferase family)